MSCFLRYAAGFGAALLFANLALGMVADVGEVRTLNLEESSSIWGAGSLCSLVVLDEYSQGCSEAPCTALNAAISAAPFKGSSKVINVICIGTNMLPCGDVNLSAPCNSSGS